MERIKWVVDPAHTEITFKVKHLMITNITGRFTDYTIDVETSDEQFSNPKIEVTAQLSSITTGNEQRDTHLKSADFFDAENNPQVKFVGTKYTKIDDENYELIGDLTIRSTTQQVKLDVETGGVIVDPYGQTKAGFTVTGKIKRKEFGLHWNAVTEAGGIVVSDEVRIICEVQLVKQ